MTNKKVSKLNRKQREYLRQCLYDCEPTGEHLYAIVDAAKDNSIPYFLEFFTNSNTSAFFNKALVGMQPQLRQIPPKWLASTTATFFPN